MGLAAGNGPEILVVDDDHQRRSRAADVLRDDGFVVIEAPTGRAALDYLLDTPAPPSLIVADLNTQVMTGWEMITVLRSYLRFASIPIVLVTGDPPPPHAFDKLRVDRLSKPYRPKELLDVVRATVGALTSATARPKDGRAGGG